TGEARWAEDRLLTLLIGNHPRGAELLGEVLGGEALASDDPQDLSRRVVEALGEQDGNLERHLDRFNPEERAHLARLSLAAVPEADERQLRAALQDCVDRIRLKSYESAMAAVEERLKQISAAEDETARDGLLREHRQLARLRTELKAQLYQGRA